MMKTTYREQFYGSWIYMRLPAVGFAITFIILHVIFFVFVMVEGEVWRNLLNIEVAGLVLLWALVPLLLLTHLAIYSYNMFPRIWVADEGLYVQFNREQIFIPWDAIIKLEKRWYFSSSYVIYAKKITKYHYFYGLGYFKFLPAIYIDPFMAATSKKRLIEIIERKLSSTAT